MATWRTSLETTSTVHDLSSIVFGSTTPTNAINVDRNTMNGRRELLSLRPCFFLNFSKAFPLISSFCGVSIYNRYIHEEAIGSTVCTAHMTQSHRLFLISGFMLSHQTWRISTKDSSRMLKAEKVRSEAFMSQRAMTVLNPYQCKNHWTIPLTNPSLPLVSSITSITSSLTTCQSRTLPLKSDILPCRSGTKTT